MVMEIPPADQAAYAAWPQATWADQLRSNASLLDTLAPDFLTGSWEATATLGLTRGGDGPDGPTAEWLQMEAVRSRLPYRSVRLARLLHERGKQLTKVEHR